MDADVVIVGAGPVGLMLAGELCLAGVRPLVLERQPRLRETPKASGFNGQIVELRRGQDPAAEALRELFGELLADEQPLRRLGALIAGTSIRYPMPGPGQHALSGTFAPDLTLHTGPDTTSVAELMHAARPVLLDLADRQ